VDPSALPPAAIGATLPLWSLLPFAALLAAIALMPLVHPRWWERNRNKGLAVLALTAPLAAWLAVAHGHAGAHLLGEKALEYLSFIALLGSLFVVSGGVLVRGSLAGTPLVNTGVLALGAVLANLVGTTGASVLLIRPLLRANRSRRRQVHLVVFFVFVVSNCGGLLTPLGDPPLFLGYLKGVPFGWTLSLWPAWLLVNGLLLLLFNFVDQAVLAREERERPGSQLEELMVHEPLRVEGGHNLLLLLAIVAVVAAAGQGVLAGGREWPFGAKEGLMLALALASWLTTPGRLRQANAFGFGPMVEVAVLFAGIFAAMAPALAILNAWGAGEREVLGLGYGLREPWQLFWASGLLSSFLDNAPTYLTFAATTAGTAGVPAEGRFLAELLATGDGAARQLSAIACGSVMMGANTYIGNGPNFMVKAIAEESGIRMPGFFGYMGWSAAVLLPTFALVTLLLFR
jgi:Na+/H+ antiporter NhaD/arsenite permease-like protein